MQRPAAWRVWHRRACANEITTALPLGPLRHYALSAAHAKGSRGRPQCHLSVPPLLPCCTAFKPSTINWRRAAGDWNIFATSPHALAARGYGAASAGAAASAAAATTAAAAGGGTGLPLDAARMGDPATLPAVPQLPLCRRPAVYVDSLSAVLEWRTHMSLEISQLGDSLEKQDGGPDEAGLLRELEWVLDDGIEAFRVRPDGPWEETSWRMLEPQVRSAVHRQQDLSSWQLRLREPVSTLWQWWEQRLRDRVPFQYLISSAHWYTYVLSVGPGVLIPRPETEIFAELVRTAVSEQPHLATAPWADLGTGSGAIAIAAADELRRHNSLAEVWAVDLSPVATAYARFNAEMCLGSGNAGVSATSDAAATAPNVLANSSCVTIGSNGGRSVDVAGCPGVSSGDSCIVRVVQGSWFEPIRHLRGRLGGVLSNPPYIPRVQMAGLQAEVGRHEPWSALDGGDGPGLDSLQDLCAEAAATLVPGGLIALETAGGEQADLVADLLRAAVVPRQLLSPTSTAPAAAAAPELALGSRAGEAGPGQSEGLQAFEAVEVLEDCYGVRRFVRAYRRRDGCGTALP